MGHSQGMDETNEISTKSSVGGVKDEKEKLYYFYQALAENKRTY